MHVYLQEQAPSEAGLECGVPCGMIFPVEKRLLLKRRILFCRVFILVTILVSFDPGDACLSAVLNPLSDVRCDYVFGCSATHQT